MFAIDDLRQTRFAQEMKAEGVHEKQRQVISRSLSRGLSVEEIAYLVDLSVEEVREIVAQIQADSQG